MFDGKAFGAEIVGAVKAHLAESLAPVLKRLDALEAVTPQQGEKGDPGRDGQPGRDAEPITAEQIRAAVLAMPDAISDAVVSYLAENPPPAGSDGKDGADGEKGEDGRDGTDGKDGLGLAGALIDRGGNLVLTLTDGTTRELGAVVGKDGQDGAPGQNGRDGFSLSDFDASLMEDGRTVLLSFDQGDQSFKVELGFPVMIYRGVFKDGQAYAKGDTVTWGGSLWHCDVERTTDKPDGAEKHWTLATKRGRDGKDAK